jgi:hypothetical protein
MQLMRHRVPKGRLDLHAMQIGVAVFLGADQTGFAPQ